MSGIYIHFPFCKSRCIYCGFYSSVGAMGYIHEYCNRVVDELIDRKGEVGDSFSTLYFGGGTPSLIPPTDFISLTESVRNITATKSFDEFTLEVNPDDVNEKMAQLWKRCGVNRFSIGVQSFNDTELRKVGRRHSAASSAEAVDLLHRYGDVSLDLIVGLHTQTSESWAASVEKAFQLAPEHLSIYMLSVDDGSALSRLVNAGKTPPPDDEAITRRYIYFCREAEKHGYVHYEVSNFCKPGKYGKHNSSYWDGTPYIGLGCSASGYDGVNRRRTNAGNLRDYLQGKVLYEEELLSEQELKEEYLITRLRRLDKGIDLRDYQKTFGIGNLEKLLNNASQYVKKGMLCNSNSFLRFTGAESLLFQDAVIRDLI